MSKYSSMFGDQSKTLTAVEPRGTTGVMSTVHEGLNPLPALSPAANSKLALAKQIKDDVGISEFGTEAGKEVAALADTILKKTTTGKMGEFGEGITQILTLTSQVNVDDLNIDKNKGKFTRIANFFKKKRVEVLAQFEDTSNSIMKIAKDLETRQTAMKDDNRFMDQLYEKNMAEYHALGASIEAIDELLKQMNTEYAVLQNQAANSTDQFFIQSVNEAEQRIKRWEKQVDRLRRMQHVALLTAPEIRQVQAGNVSMVEKFDDLLNTTIPAWKKQLSMTILAIRQKENAELGDKMDDKTNEFFRKAAELNHNNAIAVAKTSERSTVDIETLEYMQNQLIDSVKQVKQIQEAGREERKAAATKIDGLRDQMKQEMLTWK